MMRSLLIKNIKTLLQADENPRTIAKGEAMSKVPQLENAWILAENGIIKDFGTMPSCPNYGDKKLDKERCEERREERCEEFDATGRLVLPTWCDSHTHIVYAGSRESEFEMRIKGKTYEEIAANGGGILNSARRLQETSEDDLFEAAWQRLQEVRSMGTGAIEVKSGYGLTLAAELKMLRVIRRLREKSDLCIKATFLGAHAIPMAYKQNRAGYIQLIINEMLPAIAAEGLADYCDVFCDEGFYSVEETDEILTAAAKYGLKPKIHANELAVSGGVQVGVANGAVSVDHLERVSPAEIACLLTSETMPTALPGT
ncbi:MAG: hypothetical protein RI894_285, partial [Bacteroidota bacterium]